MRLPSRRQKNDEGEHLKNVILVTPGDVITEDTNYMKGHGTYGTNEEDDKRVISSVAGVVERINKLICVRPLKTRYNGEVGDVIVGRIKEIQQKRWKVETNSRLDSVLHLSSVNLRGGELRRRSAADEFAMREYLKEGDLISAEVQQVHADGALSLHTRSLRYGRLGQGCCVVVSPSLIKRRKNHMHKLACGVSIILGNNGFIWISPHVKDDDEDDVGDGGFERDEEAVTLDDRETICRLRNSILCLAKHSVMLYDTSVQYAYDASTSYEAKELLSDEVASEIVDKTLVCLDRLRDD